MKRALLGVALAGALTIGFAAQAWAGAPAGIYQGILDGSSHSPNVCGTVHNEGEGYFRVKKTSSGKKIVPVGTSSYCGGFSDPHITAPSDFHCNQYNANLTANSIALSQDAFDYSGSAPIGPGGASRHVRFKGHWDSSISKFAGFTRITSGSGCDSGKLPWHMKQVA